MREPLKNKLFLIWSNLILLACLAALAACAGISIKDTKVCGVAGVIAAGADCDNTLSNAPASMTTQEFVDFLEPQFEIKDPKTGAITTPARGAALCQSADDWNAMKTSLEEACKILGQSCTQEIQDKIAGAGARLDALQSKIKAKKNLAVQFNLLKLDPTSKFQEEK